MDATTGLRAINEVEQLAVVRVRGDLRFAVGA